MTAGSHSLIKRFASSIRKELHVIPTRSITEALFPFSVLFILLMAFPARNMDSALASVIFPRLTVRAAALEAMSATSAGCSAIIGRPPMARTALAQSLITIGWVMQWISGA